MNLNEIYNSISDFWNSIFPVFLLHMLALVAVWWVVGVRRGVLGRLERVRETDGYKRWKSLLDEFELRPKMPFLAVIAVILYLVLFNSLIIAPLSDLSITNFSYSEADFWFDDRDIDKLGLATLGAYGGNPEVRVWDVLALKADFLERYQTKYPEMHKSFVGWIQDRFAKWHNYYGTAVVFIFFLSVFALTRVRKTEYWSRRCMGKFAILFILAFAWLAFARYKAEAYVEMRLKAELSFVNTRLDTDAEAVKSKLGIDDYHRIKCRLYEDFRRPRSQMFWWSRTLESYGLITREFPTMSGEEFKERLGYLEGCLAREYPQATSIPE